MLENIIWIDFFFLEKVDLDFLFINDVKNKWDFLLVNLYYYIEFDISGYKLEVDFNYVDLVINGFNIL